MGFGLLKRGVFLFNSDKGYVGRRCIPVSGVIYEFVNYYGRYYLFVIYDACAQRQK